MAIRMHERHGPADALRSARFLVLLLLALALGEQSIASEETDDGAREHGVILLYHHVSDDTPPATSVSPDVFSSHLDHLAAQGYNVIPLDTLVAGLRGRGSLPPNAVSITFDDAYSSVFTHALPMLERRGWPFTVFVSTDYIDKSYGGYMSWAQLRAIEMRGGRIGNHSSSHRHLVRRLPDESEAAWRRRIAADIEHAQARLEAELAAPLQMHAYPYGEFDGSLEALLHEMDYVAFGQQSGPVGRNSDFRSLPRFPVATGYADLESLAEKLRSRPLPVEVVSPDSRVLAPGAGPPLLKLRIPPGGYDRRRLSCYVSGQAPAQVTWDGDIALVRAQRALRPGRSKFNCTAPSSEIPGVYFWYSHLWIRPNDDGSWYRE
ncbi:polysaccharide deacetylase family protein [Wenzhouxiangella sp. XN24]|uniref:polysaccharide deacetylase family protein n=1 Tax=Wenzhouxiangella sp. XN24 TaxID=2713569 RepID=UPI0013EAEE6A|nr:polysaccharide deacetylase family protein [Wenzhouxiangella sp. XN24]NGX16491.1 polysaccharide deacetylase family protein [Wenzhouxiangella sp. XN24]